MAADRAHRLATADLEGVPLIAPEIWAAVSGLTFGLLTHLQLTDIRHRGASAPGYDAGRALMLRLLVGAAFVTSSWFALKLFNGQIIGLWRLALVSWAPVALFVMVLPRTNTSESCVKRQSGEGGLDLGDPRQ